MPEDDQRPNILWIMADDASGGDSVASARS
jgi:hypothetical protein